MSLATVNKCFILAVSYITVFSDSIPIKINSFNFSIAIFESFIPIGCKSFSSSLCLEVLPMYTFDVNPLRSGSLENFAAPCA